MLHAASFLSILSICFTSLGANPSFDKPPTIYYEVTYCPAPAPGMWKIHLKASGISRKGGPPSLVLENWGEWTEVQGYVSDLTGKPRLRRIAATERFELEQSSRWKGRLDLRYTIPITPHGSERHQAHGLLPWRLGDTAAGYAHNTLMRVVRNGEPIDARIAIDLVAPAGFTIFTGWGGASENRQHVALDHGIDQCPIIFGREPAIATAEEEGQRYEVIQFGRAKNMTQEVLGVARPFVTAVAKNLETPFGKPVRIFITGEQPGGGGIRTDHALGLCFSPRIDPYYLILAAHEIHHEWLPGKVDDGESIVWFFEGFNDYLSLWHLAKEEIISRDWFAERLRELDEEARRSDAFGRVRFDDATVKWRDHDGPRETIAYKGGAILAFLLDAELRHRKTGSIVELLRDLIGKKRYSLDILHSWFEERDAGGLWRDLLAGGQSWPDLDAVLWSHGFFSELEVTPTRLTYLGIEPDTYGLPATVVAIDPDGPAAKTPLEVGDRIVGCAPIRWGTFRVSDEAKTRYKFGMVWLDPTAEWFTIEVERDGKKSTYAIEPAIRDGAFREERRSDEQRVAQFFR